MLLRSEFHIRLRNTVKTSQKQERVYTNQTETGRREFTRWAESSSAAFTLVYVRACVCTRVLVYVHVCAHVC